MNPLRKGPEIKLSDVKVPRFARDLYHDLRERHLLPLVAILLVGIVAAPIVLAQSPESESPESSGSAGASAGISSAPSQAGQLIAKAAPGLRADYRRRLGFRHPQDPFHQQYTQPEPEAPAAGSSSGSASSSATSASGGATTLSTETSSTGGASTPTQPEGDSAPSSGAVTYFSYAIDVRVTAGGSQQEAAGAEKSPATVRRNLPELTPLPSRETPAVIYMGATKDGKKALLLISSNVQAVFGDGVCALGSATCQLLAIEPGLPETFVYGPQGRTYRIELLKIRLVATDKLNRAPLGKPKKSDG
jgi:hypothetical protein